MSAAELRAFLEQHTGFRVPEDRWQFLAARFLPRIEARGFDEVADYVNYLDRDEQGARELDELLGLLTVRKTSFFRNAACFKALRMTVLPQLVADAGGQRALSAWSAGCASGEETYSLAMVVCAALDKDERPDGPAPYVLGTDIVHEALASAREGSYPLRVLHDVPEHYRGYLRGVGQRAWVREEVREVVEFAPHNLMQPPPRPASGSWDLILCRNVLTALTPEARKRVVANLSARCAEDGYLLMGEGEAAYAAGPFRAVRGQKGVLTRPDLTEMAA